MKQYTDDRTDVGGMNLECLILSPAFIGKQPRQIRRKAEVTRRQKAFGRQLFTSGDRMLMGMTAVAGLMFILSLFC